jgi:hypothetical protein
MNIENKRMEIVLTALEANKLYRIKQMLNSEEEGFHYSTSQVVGEAIRVMLDNLERNN